MSPLIGGFRDQTNFQVVPYILKTYPPGSPLYLDFGVGSPGDVMILGAAGLGPTDPPSPLGSAFNSGQGPPTIAKPQVSFNGRSVPVLKSVYSGLGGYQVFIQIPSDLSPGNYSVTLTIQGVASNTLPFVAKIFGIVPTQTGFTFQAVQGGGAPSPKTLQVLNGIGTVVNLFTSTTTVTGGTWLSVSPEQTQLDPSKGALALTITVNTAGLAPGDYYGRITLIVSGVSPPLVPKIVSVVLNISGPNTNPGPVIDPTGLVFISGASATTTAAQSIRITNLTNRPTSFTTSSLVPAGQPWFVATPSSGTVNPDQPGTVSVASNSTQRTPGVYPGTLLLQFPTDNVTRAVDLLLVVASGASASTQALEAGEMPRASGCIPTKLVPVYTQLGNSFNTPAAWPTAIAVQVVDDCGTALTDGSVTTTFSNGDPPLSLIPVSSGIWTATWIPQTPAASVKVHVEANQVTPKLSGAADVTGGVPDNPNVPVLNIGGVVSAASYSSKAVPSPGEMVSIFGAHLADGLDQSPGLPLSTTLQGASLVVSGQIVPLIFVTQNQVNAVLPYSIKTGTTVQILAQHGSRLSAPLTIQIAEAQPAVFTTDQTGKGQGHIYVVDGKGGQFLADAGHPAHPKDVLTIYAAGLGTVDPSAVAGAAAPLDQLLQLVNDIQLTIGGLPAKIKFAGLTPGSAGLYQINCEVPEGIQAGVAQVVITVAGIDSPPVTMSVEQ